MEHWYAWLPGLVALLGFLYTLLKDRGKAAQEYVERLEKRVAELEKDNGIAKEVEARLRTEKLELIERNNSLLLTIYELQKKNGAI